MEKKGFLAERWKRYKRSKRWWNVVLDFLFLVLIALMLIPSTRRSMSAFVVRQTLFSPRESSRTFFLSQTDWQFRFYGYDGQMVTLEEKRGRPVFLNYWATWCPPCIAEMPSIQNLYNKYKDDVHFIFISNEKPEVVESFMESRGYDLPLYQIYGPVPELFESSILPTTFIINSAGRLVLYKTGAAKWDSRRVFRMMDNMINQQ